MNIFIHICHFARERAWERMITMKLKQSKSFFMFIFDKTTPKPQIRFLLHNPTNIHLQSIIEVVHNLLQNNFIKIPPSVKRKLQERARLVSTFTTLKKGLQSSRNILKKHFRFFFYILYKSKDLILRAINQ